MTRNLLSFFPYVLSILWSNVTSACHLCFQSFHHCTITRQILLLLWPALEFTNSLCPLSISDLDPLTSASFEPQPQPGHPMVVPLNGRIEVRCLPPDGLPLPLQRSVSSISSDISNVSYPKGVFCLHQIIFSLDSPWFASVNSMMWISFSHFESNQISFFKMCPSSHCDQSLLPDLSSLGTPPFWQKLTHSGNSTWENLGKMLAWVGLSFWLEKSCPPRR